MSYTGHPRVVPRPPPIGKRPRVFTHAERRAYFVNAGTSVPEQLRPPSLSVRLTWAVVKGVYRASVWTDSKLRGRK